MLDFLGIGSRKSATTWAFKRLAMHPELYFPMGKETHYWDHGKHAAYYMRAFRQDEFASRNGWKCGEITPSYAVLPAEKIAALKREFPAARAFLIARCPAERMMSSIKQAHRRGRVDRMDVRTILEHFGRSMQLDHSRYRTILDNWRSHYDVKVVLFDDIVSAPKSVLRAICRHIGVGDAFFDLLPDRVVAEPVNAHNGIAPPPEVWQWVLERIEDDIAAVERATNRDLSHWRHYSPASTSMACY